MSSIPEPSQIWRFEIDVDDEWHDYRLGGDPLHVAAVRPDLVEFWAYSWPLGVGRGGSVIWSAARRLRVFGSGHDLPDKCRHWGTCTIAVGARRAVWHLVEDCA